MSWEEISAIMSEIVPVVMEKHNMNETIEMAKEFRCFEDFDYRDSSQKRDLFRKWYHTRTRHPIVSFEDIQLDESGEFIPLEIYDEKQDFEDKVSGKILVEQFKAGLSEKDIEILTMRMEGLTYEEIADKLDYKNHSGVLKRIKRIAEAYKDFCNKNEITY